ncbi:MAG: redoxin domain-containing protein [Anaerolineales bacterium]
MSTLDEQMKSAEQEWLDGWKRGPQRLRWTKVPLQVGDEAPDFDLLDSNGQLANLSNFWKMKPATILFWRHYGCGCGVERAGMMQKDHKAFHDAGGQVVIIGQGEPERAAAYAAKYELPPIPILCDPDFTAYEAFGLVEGKPSQILFDAPDEFLDREFDAGVALANERRELGRSLVDNSWLLPGEFVVDRGGIVRLAYRYNYCEDFPDYRVLTAAIREAVIEGP